MTRHMWFFACLGALVLLAACGSDEKAKALQPSAGLTVSAEPKSIPADAIAKATVTVGGTRRGPVELHTTLGILIGPDGSEGANVTLDGDGTVSLRSACDARVDDGCVGAARVSARDADNATGSVTVSLAPVESCNNGKDDDGDGAIDCADTADCPVNSNCGVVENGEPEGLACGSTGSCDKCVPPSGVESESKESTCNDGGDNDCDGAKDCADSDCDGSRCLTSNEGVGTCVEGQCACEATGDEVCDDGLDNDCDGKTDCEATSCEDRRCQTESGSIGECNAGLCECVASDEICTDGLDNDCDDKVDCADDECEGEVCEIATGLLCGSGASATCSVCPSGETVEADCGDGVDNDCDGQADCADSDCEEAVCGGDGMTCQAGVCECAGGTAESACGDGLDNDCDGSVDCMDDDCGSTTVGQYGSSCDASNSFGKVCNWLGECLCPPYGALTETSCSDGADNDCDGKLDCLDEDCTPGGVAEALPCDANGHTCANVPNASGELCALCPTGLSVESTCTDGVDDDCDGDIDCADTDCIGHGCDSNGFTCSSSLSCTCPGGGGTETLCGDGSDNDCDGQIDCLDANCKGTAVGQYGKNCDTASTFGKVCDWLGACVCKTGALAETLCGNGTDDDCDGLIDCQDDDCRPGGVSEANTCDTLAHTCAAVPNLSGSYCTLCPGGEAAEVTCGDQIDNDCDGLVDCWDADCLNLQCGPSASQKCQPPHDCIDSTTAYVLNLTPESARIPADGLATTVVNVVLTNPQGGSVVGQSIDLAISGVGIWVSNDLQLITVQTDTQGTASALLRSDAAGGVANITGQLASAGTGAQTSVQMPTLADIKVISVQSDIMGAKTSGYQEQDEIVFQLLAPNGVAYPEGLEVEFSHEPAGGSTIGTPPVASCFTPGCSVTATGVTSGSGLVSIVMHSGTVADTRTVTVEGTAGGQTRQATSPNIAIVGAKVSGSRITLACTPRNVPGFANHNCIKSLVDGQITCSVTLADRFNNVLGVSTVASFAAEVGVVGPPSATPQYPAANLGKTSTYINVQGGDLPIDVEPLTNPAEESLEIDTACGTLIHNPRDGAATVLVMVPGEEGFADLNGDGVRSPGEPFVDLPEPFVDANDNNVQDDNEPYLDANGNQKWDDANGIWDASSTMWAQTRIVYSGKMYSSTDQTLPYSRFLEDTFSSAPPDTSLLTRPSLNPITRGVNVDFGFVIVDNNLNVLPSTGFGKVTYSTSVSGPVTFSIINTLPPQREEGFFFAQEYCDAADTTKCGPTCPPASAPSAASCVVRSRYGDFEYGLVGNARVRGTADGPFSISLIGTTATHAATLGASGTVVSLP